MQKRESWTVVRDPYGLAPYAYRERQWVGYDDMESIAIKTRFANAMNLGGAMIWSIETDDFLGECHGQKFPLLNTINRVFAEGRSEKPTPAPVPTTTEKDYEAPEKEGPEKEGPEKEGPEKEGPEKEGPPASSSTTPSSSTQEWERPSTWWTPSSTTTTTANPWTSSSTTSNPSWTWSTSSTTGNPAWTWATQSTTSSTTSTTTQPSTSTTTQSSTSTTTQSSGSGEKALVCREDGMFRNPNDCKRFYRCVATQVQGRFFMYEYTCPSETVFDEATRLCMWPQSVPECSNYYTSKDTSVNEVERESNRRRTIIDP